MKKLTFLFLITFLPLMANSQTVVVDGITYNLLTKGKIAEVALAGSYSGDIVIPEKVTYNEEDYKVTTILEKAFANCSLNSIEIPSSINKICSEAFSNGSVTSVKIKDLAAWCNISFGSYFQTNPLYKASHFFLNDEEIHDLVIPDGVKSLGDWQFYQFTGLTSVKIPSSVTSIGKDCFAHCSGIKTVVIGDNTSQEAATVIGVRAFGYCNNIDSVVLGNNIVEIGNSVFSGCKGTHSLVIPNSVKKIGGGAFAGWDDLESIQLSENLKSIENGCFSNCTNLKEIVIPDGVELLGESAFSNCTNLTSVKLPSSLKKIDWCVFQYCTSLTSIEIPDKTNTIYICAFDGCSNLKTVTLGKSMQNIQNGAFANCPLLEDVYCKANTPPTCYTAYNNLYGKVMDSFYNSYVEYINLHVPEASVETYKATEPWNGFGSIVAMDEPVVEKCATPTITFIDGKLTFDCETEDVKFVYTIIPPSTTSGEGENAEFSTLYTIKVYATKNGYEDSDIATKEINVGGTIGIKGDVNEDGTVNGTDIQEVINIIVNAE